jgi:hypothetical protein
VKVDVVARLTHIWKTGVVVTALLATVVACGSSDSSRARNAALVAGTSCVKPGAVTKISKVSVVCAKTTTGNIWYPTMKSHGRSVACSKPGVVRKKKSVVWVCGVVKSKKLWQATSPLPPAVLQASVVIAPGVVEPVPVLESTEVATPSRPVVADNNVLANPTIADEPPVTTPLTNPPVVTVPVTSPPVVTAPPIVATCAEGGPCVVRDIGPGGGIVFYDAGTTPFNCGENPNAIPVTTCTYLEAAITNGTTPSTWTPNTQAQWGCNSTFITGTSLEIGTGRANTKMITGQGCKGTDNSMSAASIAAAYNGGGKTDWFLPSRKELNALCLEFFNDPNSKYVGNGWWTGYQLDGCRGRESDVSGATNELPWSFASDYYWSSSEVDAYGAWGQYFYYGAQYNGSKAYTSDVRPVRAF